MQNSAISKPEVDAAIFKFLQSIYLFEKREATKFGITWGETYFLQLLRRTPGMSVSETAKQLGVQDFFASRMVTKLGKEGLVRREGSKGDRRVVKVYLTDSGKQKLDEIDDFNYKIICSKTDDLSAPDIKSTMNALEHLGTFLGLV